MISHYATRLGRRAVAAARHGRHAVRRWAAALRPIALDAAGLGLLASAAWTLALPAGLAAFGVACLVLNWRLHAG